MVHDELTIWLYEHNIVTATTALGVMYAKYLQEGSDLNLAPRSYRYKFKTVRFSYTPYLQSCTIMNDHKNKLGLLLPSWEISLHSLSLGELIQFMTFNKYEYLDEEMGDLSKLGWPSIKNCCGKNDSRLSGLLLEIYISYNHRIWSPGMCVIP